RGRLYIFEVTISNNALRLAKEKRMVTPLHAPIRVKAPRLLGLILLCLSVVAAGQTTPKSSTSTAKKTPAKSAAATKPTAVIHTTSGDMKCELFPDQAPKTVANFIGLAKGTKEWKDPTSGKPVHGKPLYDGVIFHRTIPEFMIQTGDPTGT